MPRFRETELRVGHSTARVLADSFVDILNRDGVTSTGQGNGAAIENEAWNIQAARAITPPEWFVAADQDDQSVEEIATGN